MSLINTCRICGCQDAAAFVDVVSEGNLPIMRMFVDLFVGIRFDDRKLPTCVCHICIATTSDFYRVWKTYPEIQEKLTALFNDTDTVVSSESTFSHGNEPYIARKPNSENRIDVNHNIPNLQRKSKNYDKTDNGPISTHQIAPTVPPTVIRKCVKPHSGVKLAVKTPTSSTKKRIVEEREPVCITIMKDKNDFKVKKSKRNKNSAQSPPKEVPSKRQAPSKTNPINTNKFTKLDTDTVSRPPANPDSLRKIKDKTGTWQELQVPGKKAKVYHCCKCNCLLLTEEGKETHECNSLPTVSVTLAQKKTKKNGFPA